jgi:outer membrane biosynthesis protein TonB
MARNAPPPPAQSGKVITRAADPSEPVDMSSFTMVTGESTSYAGGVSAAAGTSKTAVNDIHARVGAAPVHIAGPPSAPSQARPSAPSRDDWSCAWPDDEQDSDLNDARVAIQVSVDRDGSPESVQIINSPKPTFAEAARRCALSESYRPALDFKGDRIASTTKPFLVHFIR